MKIARKAFAIVAILVLLCCALVVATSAAAESISELAEPWQYTDSSGNVKTAASLVDAVSGAATGSTIKLLCDQTVSTTAKVGTSDSNPYVKISKKLTIDLGGHTFKMSQSYQRSIGINTTSEVIIQNGTLVATGNSSLGSSGKGYALIRTYTTGTKITLKDVNTYSAAVVLAGWVGNTTVKIEGGSHYLTYADTGMQGGGLVETRLSCNVNVSNALIYLSNGAPAVNSMSFNDKVATKSNKFTFTNCQILTQNGTDSMVYRANEFTTIDFIGCDLYGAITPSIISDDKNKGYGVIKSGAIVLSGGTRIGGAGELNITDAVTCKDGESVMVAGEYVDFTVKKPSGNMYYNFSTGTLSSVSFNISEPSTHTVRFIYSYGTADDYLFGYDTLYSTCYTDDFALAATYAKSKITLNRDAEFTADDVNTLITRDLTLDLGGHTLKIVESASSSLELCEGVNVNVRNGNLIKIDANGAVGASSVFTATGKGATLTLDGVFVDASVLLKAYGDEVKVVISGGTHGNQNASTSYDNVAYIELSGENSTVDMDNATLLVGTLKGFSIPSGGADIQLVRVPILGRTSSDAFIGRMTKDTTFTLKGCEVFASFNVTGYNDSPSDYYGKVKLLYDSGCNTKFASMGSCYGLLSTEYKKVFSQANTVKDITYVDAHGNSFTNSYSLKYSVKIFNSKAKTIYSLKGQFRTEDDLVKALNGAARGTEITLFADFTLTADSLAFATLANDGVTLNLNGHTITVIETGEASINVLADIKIINGTIRVAADSSIGGVYPLFRYASTDVDITLENVDTYAPALFLAKDCDGGSLTVIGGRHHIMGETVGYDNAWLDVRGDFGFTAKDSVFFMNGDAFVVSALSFEDGDGQNLGASFAFDGCKIISEGGNANVIGYANKNTIVNFTDCDIYASVNPILNGNDSASGISAIGAGAITLGGRVRLSSGGTYISGGVIKNSDGSVTSNGNFSEKTVYESYYFLSDSTTFYTDERIIDVSFGSIVMSGEEAYVTVKWFKEDGVTLIREDKVLKGTTLTPPTYTSGESNGWFTAVYSGWSVKLASDVKATDFTATKNQSYYPALSGSISANLTAARYNLTLVGRVCNNLYLPMPIAGIKLNGVFVGENEIEGKSVTVGGEKFYLYTVSEVAAARLNTATTVTVKYSVRGVALEAAITLNPYDYVEEILRDSTLAEPKYPASAHAVAADLARYSNALCTLVDGKSDSALDALITKYESVLTDLVSPNSFSEYRANMTALEGIISSVQLEISSTEPRWVFNIASGVSVKSIELIINGYFPEEKNGANFGEITYTTTLKNSGAYFTEYIPIYNLDRLMTVKVTLSDGTIATGKYSLNAYYGGLSAENADSVREFLKAFRTLGVSSLEYKYGGETKSESTGLDFFKCDHEHVGAFYAGRGRYCPDCATSIFFYSDFGAVADGESDRNLNASGTNAHEAMYKCHEAANVWKKCGNKVAVMAVGGAHNGTKYYISTPYSNKSIPIATDTSWSGAEFIIDDRNISQSSTAYETPIFEAVYDKGDSGISYTAMMQNGLSAGDKSVGFAPGRPMMLLITDKSRRNNIRQGNNANDGESIHEMIIVDEYGNISDTTPVEWDYFNVSYCKYGCATVDSDSNGKCDTCSNTIGKSLTVTGYATDVEPITISGHDKNGNINCVWETVTSSNVTVTAYDQCQRAFTIARSNVTSGGIDHIFTEDGTSTTPRQAYAGVINVYRANNVTLKDMLVEHHIGHYLKDGTSIGSYEMSGKESCNITLINYQTKDFFKADGSVTSRGLFGTNYIRNFYIKDSTLLSFDSHSGAYNVVIEDSVFLYLNFVGGGDVHINNVTIYADAKKGGFVLRHDYGSLWHGNIYVNGLEFRCSADRDYSVIDLIKAEYRNWYFGTDTYLPTNVVINDLTINEYTRNSGSYVFENGTVVEDVTPTNEVSIAVYKLLNSQLVDHIDYSKASADNLDPKHPTETFSFNNCGDLKIVYPDHPFFSDMKIFIDGVEKKDWFKKRSGLQCEDLNGDFICDMCMLEIICDETHPTTGSGGIKCAGCGAIRNLRPGELAACEYISGGETMYLSSGVSIKSAITAADEGTTITLLQSMSERFSGVYTVNKNITINLNGQTLSIISTEENYPFVINTGKTLTFEGGTIVCMEPDTGTQGRPIVGLKDKSTVNYNNVTVYAGCIAFSYSGEDCNVNINGGEFYAITESHAGQAAFIETRANMNFTATNATFLLTNLTTGNDYYLISSSSNYQGGDSKASTFTFNNCDIIKENRGWLVYNANQYTKIKFDSCRVYGELNNGNLYSEDKAQGIGASVNGLYEVTGGTLLYSSSLLGEKATYTSTADVSKTVTYNLKKVTGTLFGNDFEITDATITLSFNLSVS